ncbi:hypothetical protein [Pseudomonas sp. P7548]|uniref:hypothetical protein n=1 Tax=Pseudomonas sp. P7548 TaxID=2726981 RepID=UPI0015BDD355|nr:hypothetical protein [Pseudomonas sp. P7548]NWE17931.1 hypothetical protein [Pseudomonas sp. P7548]
MKRIAVVVALSLLSGCSLQTMNSRAKAEPAFAEVLKQPPLVDSILRDGDDLSYQVQVTPGKGASVPDIAQVRASCATPSASLLFLESPGTPAADGQPKRFTVMRELTPQVIDYLKQNAAFIDACARTPRPDWRVVSSTATQRQLLIDRASLKATADTLQFWGAYDEPFVLINRLQKMPYAQTRLHFQANCSRQTYRTLASFGIHKKNVVTFGKTETSPQDAPFSTAESDTQALLNAACGPAAALERLPVATPRDKITQTLMPTPLPPAVLDAITALGLAKPDKTLSHLVVKTEFGSSSLQNQVFIETDAASGQLHLRHVSDFSTHDDVTFRGLIPLTYQAQYEFEGLTRTAATTVEQLSFSGDWKQMPTGTTLGFSYTTHERSNERDERNYTRDNLCLVKRQLPASKINSALSGDAKELDCQTIGSGNTTLSTVYYLQDYGYFFSGTRSEARSSKDRMILLKAQ